MREALLLIPAAVGTGPASARPVPTATGMRRSWGGAFRGGIGNL